MHFCDPATSFSKFTICLLSHRRVEGTQGEILWNKETCSQVRILVNNCPLHWSVTKFRQFTSLRVNIPSQVCNYTDTVSRFSTLSNTDKSVQVPDVVTQLQEKNKQLLNEVENDIMKFRHLRSNFNNCFVIHFLNNLQKGTSLRRGGLETS